MVEVRTASEILQTLDADGTLDGLPFMPAMIERCRKRYRVSQCVVQAVVDAASLGEYSESYLREFRGDDVVLLDELRCSGTDYGGCQRGCMTFWKEAWLHKVDEATPPAVSDAEGVQQLRSRLKTSSRPDIYVCQSGMFLKATMPISRLRRVWKCFGTVRAGNCSSIQLLKQLKVWAWWKIRPSFMGEWPRGNRKSTSVDVLDLQAGELVELKPLEEIVETLDRSGRNRGLHFSADMRVFCGRQYRVRSRVDRLISEGLGKMGRLRHTVILEGVCTDSAYYAFGGCPRREFQYWREIWLRRIQPSRTSGAEPFK